MHPSQWTPRSRRSSFRSCRRRRDERRRDVDDDLLCSASQQLHLLFLLQRLGSSRRLGSSCPLRPSPQPSEHQSGSCCDVDVAPTTTTTQPPEEASTANFIQDDDDDDTPHKQDLRLPSPSTPAATGTESPTGRRGRGRETRDSLPAQPASCRASLPARQSCRQRVTPAGSSPSSLLPIRPCRRRRSSAIRRHGSEDSRWFLFKNGSERRSATVQRSSSAPGIAPATKISGDITFLSSSRTRDAPSKRHRLPASVAGFVVTLAVEQFEGKPCVGL